MRKKAATRIATWTKHGWVFPLSLCACAIHTILNIPAELVMVAALGSPCL